MLRGAEGKEQHVYLLNVSCCDLAQTLELPGRRDLMGSDFYLKKEAILGSSCAVMGNKLTAASELT